MISRSKEKAAELLKDIYKLLYFKIDKKQAIENANKPSNLINKLKITVQIPEITHCKKEKNRRALNSLFLLFF